MDRGLTALVAGLWFAIGCHRMGHDAVGESRAPVPGMLEHPATPPSPDRGIPLCGAAVHRDARVVSCEALEPIDLAPLATLPRLTTVQLSGPGIVDLSPLAKIATIESVVLDSIGTEDLSPLVSLPAVRSLALGRGVSDLSTLAGMRTLTHIDLSGSAVLSLQPLSTNEDLRELILVGSPLVDFAPLRHFPRLEKFVFEQAQAEHALGNSLKTRDLQPVATMLALRHLVIREVSVIDCAPISGANALESVELDDVWGCNDMSPFASLSSLRSLSLNETFFEDPRLEPLVDLRELEYLDLSATGVRDLRPLVKLPKLRSLRFWSEDPVRGTIEHLQAKRPDIDIDYIAHWSE